MSTDADHDWLDKSVDAPTVPVGCHRSHPHENMDSTCERFTQYERENASLRGELTTRERLYKEQWQRAEQAEARALAAEKLHMDLIMQVARKWPNESRHETAKRYITEAENRPSSGPSQAAIGAKHG